MAEPDRTMYLYYSYNFTRKYIHKSKDNNLMFPLKAFVSSEQWMISLPITTYIFQMPNKLLKVSRDFTFAIFSNNQMTFAGSENITIY